MWTPAKWWKQRQLRRAFWRFIECGDYELAAACGARIQGHWHYEFAMFMRYAQRVLEQIDNQGA